MAPNQYLFKSYNRQQVYEFTSSMNFPNTVGLECARKVYWTLALSALSALGGSVVQGYTENVFTPDVSMLNLLLMIWWAFYLKNSQTMILGSVIVATFLLGLTLGGQHVTTCLHLDERTPSYAFAGVAFLFLSHLAALFTSSPALVFNHNILSLPLYISVILSAQLHFSPPSSQPPSGDDVVMAFLRPHLSLVSPPFIAVTAFLWLFIFCFFREPNLRLGFLVPSHLHLMSLLVYLSGRSLSYLTFVYTVSILFAYNLRYHAFDTMLPPAVSTSTHVPQGALILAPNVPGDGVIILSGRYPDAQSCVFSFFTHFLGRSTYIMYQPVSVIVALVWGISHVQVEAVRAAILRNWLSAKIYGFRVWGACYAFYGCLIDRGRFTVRWFEDLLFKTATFLMLLVLLFAIVFAFKNWSKIAQHLPGRTDNEIKNYWRTRVQKHAKQLKCDVNSKQFKDTMRYLWMPRLAERIQAASTTTTTTVNSFSISSTDINTTTTTYPFDQINIENVGTTQSVIPNTYSSDHANKQINHYTQDTSSNTAVSPVSDLTDCYYPISESQNQNFLQINNTVGDEFDCPIISPSVYFNREMDFEGQMEENNHWSGENNGDFSDSLWNDEDILYLEQHFNSM